MKILIVDDEIDILEFLSYNLEKEGYRVFTAQNGLKAVEKAKKYKPDLIILDVMMPEMDGITTCSEIRLIPDIKDVLIVFLTARSEEYSELAGFSAGADDYITKPVKPKLLISRIKALSRRSRSKDDKLVINISPIKIDPSTHRVFVHDEEVYLAKKEFRLLYMLMTVPGKVFSRQEIISEVWEDAVVGDRTIDVHIRKIREKIGDNHIKTIKGVGYKFNI